MAASLGSLVVSLGLDAAQFTSGMDKSEAAARRFSQSLSNQVAIGIIKAEVALRALGEAFSFAFRAIPDLARQVGNFQDLAEKTGANAEALAGFAIALNITSKSSEDLGDFMIKLSKNLVGVEDGTDKAGSALLALGINIKQFKALDPAAQIEALSKALAKFSDVGGGKAAVLEAIARGGAQLLPFLKELNEQGGRNTILTKEQIELADKFSDAQARASGQLKAYAEVAAIKTLQAITDLTNATKEFVKELTGVDKSSKDLAGNKSIETWADSGARAIAFVVDAAQGLSRTFEIVGNQIAVTIAARNAVLSGNFAQAIAMGKAAKADLDEILARPFFSDKLEAQIANRGKNAAAAAAAAAANAGRPALGFGGPSKDATKGILDGQIKAFEASIAREKDILNARADYLQDYFRDGLLSVSDYYSKLQQARDDELQNVLRFYDLEIAAANQAKAKAKNAVERQDFTNKIVDIQAKQANILRDSFNAEEKLTRERNRATREYADQLDELNAKMLDLAGNTAAAAAIRFDAQNRVLINSLKASGDTGALGQADALKAQQVALANINDLTRRYSLTLGDVSIAQAKIDLEVQSGSLSEIQALNKRSEVALQYVDTLRKQADAAEAAANALSGIDKLFALQNVQRFRLEIEQLAASTDALAKKFNDIGSSALATFFEDMINRTKSFKQAVIDMAKSIEQSITKLISEDLSKRLFKSVFGDPSSGLDFGQMLAKLLGAAVGGPSFGGDGGGIPAFAAGTNFVPRDTLAVVHRGEAIIPAAQNKGRRTVVHMGGIHINVPQGTSRASSDQIGLAAARAAQRALGKLG